MRSGWFRESYRHSLAARGISTSRFRRSFMPVNLYEHYDKDLGIHGGKTLYRFDELSPSEQFEARKEYYHRSGYYDEGDELIGKRFNDGLHEVQVKEIEAWEKDMASQGINVVDKGLFHLDSDSGDIRLSDDGFVTYFNIPDETRFGDITVRGFLINHDPLDYSKYGNPFVFDFYGTLPKDVDRAQFRNSLEKLILPKEKQEEANKIIASLAELQKKLHKATYSYTIDDTPLKDKYFDADSNGEVHMIKDVVPVAETPEKMHLVHAPSEWDLEYSGVRYK